MSRSSRIWIGLIPSAPAEAPPVSGAISATGIITFSDDATITGGLGPIDGSGAITFSELANLIGTGTLDGSETITISELALLTGTGALLTSETITFSELATLVATGALAVSGTIIFSNLAILTGTGTLDTSESITFNELATLDGTGTLAVIEPIIFTSSAALTALATQIQDQFRFGADDGGNEATHGWLAAQNVNITQAASIAAILRFQLNNIGDFPGQKLKIQQKITTQDDSEYRDIPVEP